jgi:hypothetical protein
MSRKRQAVHSSHLCPYLSCRQIVKLSWELAFVLSLGTQRRHFNDLRCEPRAVLTIKEGER